MYAEKLMSEYFTANELTNSSLICDDIHDKTGRSFCVRIPPLFQHDSSLMKVLHF